MPVSSLHVLPAHAWVSSFLFPQSKDKVDNSKFPIGMRVAEWMFSVSFPLSARKVGTDHTLMSCYRLQNHLPAEAEDAELNYSQSV